MSKKRPTSKRWDVEPDYEPPATRHKVPAQSYAPPTRSRKRSAQVIPPVAAPAPPVAAPAPPVAAAAPPVAAAAPPDGAQPAPENQSRKEDEETRKEDEETMKEDEETMKDDEETMKQNEGSMSENEETRKEDEETMKEDVETMKDDEETMKQNEGSMRENEEIRKEDEETIKEIEETIKQSQKEKNAMGNDTKELAAMNQLEETLTLNQIEEMTWENQIEGAIVEHQVENPITGNRMENTEVDRIQQCVSNFGPEDMDEFEQRPMVNESDETDQRTIEAEIRESAAKPVHERDYCYNLIIGLTGEGGRGNPNGSTAKTFSTRNPERPTGKPVRNLTTVASNSVLHNRTAAAPAAVSTQDDSDSVTTHPPLRLAAPHNETDQNGPRNDEPRLSNSEVIGALRRNALLLSAEPVRPKEDLLKERRFVSTLVQGLEMLNEKLSFSVVSYNIMSEPELGTEIEGSGSGNGRQISNSSNGKAGTDHLPSNYYERLLKELSYLEPDIYCLQSVTEKCWYKLLKYLNNRGYTGSSVRRRRLEGSRSYFEVIFFKTSRFELVTSRGIYLDDLIVQNSVQPDVVYHPGVRKSVESREVAAFMTLRCRVTDRKVTVASVRCVPEHRNRPDLQAAQVCCVVQALAGLSANPSEDPMPTILCGDLDFHPKSGPYQILRDGFISKDTEQCFSGIESVVVSDGEKCPLLSVDRAAFRHPLLSIRSAYDKAFGSEPPNVWKRESETFVCSSYVWYDEAQLKLVGVLDMVDSKAVTGSGIPNEVFPSCSLSLKASFQFCEVMPGTG